MTVYPGSLPGTVPNQCSAGGYHKYVYSNGVVLCEHCGQIAGSKVLPNDYGRMTVTSDWQGNYETQR